jgi:3-deoxy-manno-octulosonate cytidylyltransferase (CMP-KDO synthetase)
MSPPRRPIVLIPARLRSARLPGKPLADIHGEPMVVHCWRRGVAADVGPVYVACAETEIARAVEAAGGNAIVTDPGHPSGSDRVYEALQGIDPDGPDSTYDAVIVLQGDLPTIEPAAVRAAFEPLRDPDVAIATLVAVIRDETERRDPSVVKAVMSFAEGATIGRALYFSRAIVPSGEGRHFHHIGLYAYRREALERFVKLPQAPLERRERLEQLRALEAGMRIDAALVDTVPLGVDTRADLALAREILAQR